MVHDSNPWIVHIDFNNYNSVNVKLSCNQSLCRGLTREIQEENIPQGLTILSDVHSIATDVRLYMWDCARDENVSENITSCSVDTESLIGNICYERFLFRKSHFSSLDNFQIIPMILWVYLFTGQVEHKFLQILHQNLSTLAGSYSNLLSTRILGKGDTVLGLGLTGRILGWQVQSSTLYGFFNSFKLLKCHRSL